MPERPPSGPFTFTSRLQLRNNYFPNVPTNRSFMPERNRPNRRILVPKITKSSTVFSSLTTRYLFTKALPLVLIYSVIGKLVFAPLCAQLILNLAIEVAGIITKTADYLALQRASEEWKNTAVEALAEAKSEIHSLNQRNLAAAEQSRIITEKLTVAEASLQFRLGAKDDEIRSLRHDLISARAENATIGSTLRQEVAKLRSELDMLRERSATTQKKLQQSVTKILLEKCDASELHRSEMTTLKTRMEKDRAEATLTRHSLRQTIAEQARSEKIRTQQLDSIKKELTQATSIQHSLRQTIAEQARSEQIRTQQLNTIKKELAQAENELLKRNSLPPPSPIYQDEGSRIPSIKVSSQAARPSYLLPDDLKILDPHSAGFTCIGITKKGLRCRQFMISNAAKMSANEQLLKMRSNDPGNTFELAQLQQLASWMMCPRWHSGHAPCPQHRDVAARWFQQLKSAREELANRKNVSKTSTHPILTPVRPILFGANLSTNSSCSSLSSSSSIFSAASYGSTSSVGMSPDSSPLAKKNNGVGRRMM